MKRIKNTKRELDKVSWLSKKETFNQFIIVHVISGVFVSYFLFIDVVVSSFKNLFN